MAPGLRPAKAPVGPRVTDRRSLSLPTQVKTKSAPSAAAFGVGADRPPYSATHFSAFAVVRLKTVSSCPPRLARWPAIGYPITPKPMNATFAIPTHSRLVLSWDSGVSRFRRHDQR